MCFFFLCELNRISLDILFGSLHWTVTLDVQLHHAVLFDIIEIMKDFMQQFLPALLSANKTERSALFPVAQQFSNRIFAA